jgi:phosphomannomutase
LDKIEIEKKTTGINMTGIFEAYDIRGTYPQEIDGEKARGIGLAFARYLDKKRVVIGHDMRDSSPELNQALSEGLRADGVEVTDIGLATTPMLYTAIIDGKFDGGVMVTASHLPAQYNGLKLCREKAIPLSEADGLPEVEALFRKTPTVPAAIDGQPRQLDFLGRYLEILVPFEETPEPLRIVADAGNGMGGLDTPHLFEHYPQYDFIPMYMQPDGDFPHHVPNPSIPENTAELQQRVVAEKADLGIAFDGDCDRCGFVDETGARVPADLVIAVLAEYFLKKTPGATVLYDLRASRAVPERIRQLGGNPVKTRVGHSFIKEKMREENAVFAGELSGHYYYREAGFIDSGILSMISMLNLLAQKKAPLSQLVHPLQKYAQSGEINLHVHDNQRLFQELESTYQDGQQEHLDGLSIEYPDWWFNLRESHTEPLVRLVIEADDQPRLQQEKTRLLKIISKYQDQTGVQES